MKSFSSHFNLRRNIESHPAVDNEGEVVSWRNVVQSRKKKKDFIGQSQKHWVRIVLYDANPNPNQSKSKTIYMSWMLIPYQHILIQL